MHDDLNPSLSRVSVIMAELLHIGDKTRQWCTVNSYTSIVTTFGDILYACIIFTSMSIFMEIHWTSSLLSVSECIWWLMMHVGRSPVPVNNTDGDYCDQVLSLNSSMISSCFPRSQIPQIMVICFYTYFSPLTEWYIINTINFPINKRLTTASKARDEINSHCIH